MQQICFNKLAVLSNRKPIYMDCSLWPYTPKIDRARWAFLGLSDMRHGF